MIGRSTTGDRLVLAVACCGSVLVILDATIVSVALPDIRATLGMSTATLPWVVNAYTLAFAGFLLLGGRLSDRFGRRRMFVLGMSLFTIARAAAGLVDDPTVLLAARAIQGLGGALLMPVTLSLLTSWFTDPAARARALGTWSAVGALGAASGPVLGGVLTQWLGWRSVFVVSLPLGVAAVLAALRLPRTDDVSQPGSLDVVGTVTVTLGLVGTVYAVMRVAVVGWLHWTVVAPFAAGLFLLALFLLHQARWAADPLVPLSLFRARAVVSGNAVMFLLGLGFFACPVLLSLYFQDVHGLSPFEAGIAFLPIGAAMFAGARTAGGLAVRFGARRAAAWCCGIGAVGFAGVASAVAAQPASALWTLVPGVVFGFGTAAAFTPVTVIATSSVPARHNGLAAGLLNTVRQASGAIGLAVLSTVAASVTAAWHGSHPQLDRIATLAHGYTIAFFAATAFLVVATGAAAWTLPRR